MHKKPFLIRHIEGENQGRFPVWMMRQAGRYLPRYRSIRKEIGFWDSVKDPKVAAEISLLPLELLPVDAVIFFSDILTLPFGMGLPITLQESVGPVNATPLRDLESFKIFQEYVPEKHTPYVSEALSIVASRISPETSLLGFAGAPWTVGSYLIEGKANKHFGNIKGWMYKDPESLSVALNILGKATVTYLKSQVKSGTHMVQLFDTWIGEMPVAFFRDFYRPCLESIFSELKKDGIRSIYFTKNSTHLMPYFKGLSCNGFSVDALYTLTEAQRMLGSDYFLQGNLDPTILLSADEGTVRLHTRKLVSEARNLPRPSIMNLGHGILPGTSVENVKAFVEEARVLWV